MSTPSPEVEPHGALSWARATVVTSDVLESAAKELLEMAASVAAPGSNSLTNTCYRWWVAPDGGSQEEVGERGFGPLDLLGAASANAGLMSLSLANTTPDHFAACVTTAVGVALGESTTTSAKELVLAYALGRIVGTRVQDVLDAGARDLRWGDATAAARVGAGVCAAALLHLDATQIQSTIGLAATQASGTSGSSGTDLVAWRLGCASRDSLLAALLGATPWVGPRQPLDGTRGLYRLCAVPANTYEFGGGIDPGQILALLEADEVRPALAEARLPFSRTASIVDLSPRFVRVRSASGLSKPAHATAPARKESGAH